MTKTTIPAAAKRIALRPLALGEQTGHHHSLVAASGTVLEDIAEMFEMETESGVKHYLRVSGDGVALVHQEHKAHPVIALGEYEVVIQQENTDWGVSRMRD